MPIHRATQAAATPASSASWAALVLREALPMWMHKRLSGEQLVVVPCLGTGRADPSAFTPTELCLYKGSYHNSCVSKRKKLNHLNQHSSVVSCLSVNQASLKACRKRSSGSRQNGEFGSRRSSPPSLLLHTFLTNVLPAHFLRLISKDLFKNNIVKTVMTLPELKDFLCRALSVTPSWQEDHWFIFLTPCICSCDSFALSPSFPQEMRVFLTATPVLGDR